MLKWGTRAKRDSRRRMDEEGVKGILGKCVTTKMAVFYCFRHHHPPQWLKRKKRGMMEEKDEKQWQMRQQKSGERTRGKRNDVKLFKPVWPFEKIREINCYWQMPLLGGWTAERKEAGEKETVFVVEDGSHSALCTCNVCINHSSS